MPLYPPYTTTVVGAHSVPRWYESLDRMVSLGQLAGGDFADAQLRATQAAILEQEIAGIDVITGGEMHRRRHNRHSPRVRPRASGRGTDAPTSSQTPRHLDSRQNPVEPAPALVNRQEGQGKTFHFPSPRHDFTAVPRPLARQDLQPPVRNSIGVSVPSNNINSRTAPSVPNSRPIVPETFSVQHGATSRIGSINTRPVAPGGPARGTASLPTTSRTAAINGTRIMRRGIGSPQIGGPAR